ncbi:MAG: hypothetical protein JXD23_14930 [Spirochaetales bacterium]|nr:hypothetical protein [Spirochaetales bacterium]
MMKSVLVVVLSLAVVSAFSLASLRAEEKTGVSAQKPDAAPLVSNPRPVAAAAAQPPAAGPQTVGDNPFSPEKIIIGLGLCAVIALAVFRWGKASGQNRQGKDEAASGSPPA